MDAIIICAGYATRMYPYTKTRTKSLLKVGHKLVLDYLMEQIVDSVDKIHVVTNHKFHDKYIKWQENWPKVLLYDDGTVHEKDKLGACGDLKFCYDNYQTPMPENTLVIAGDNIFRFELKPIIEHFQKANDNYVLAMKTPLEEMSRTGELILEGNRVIKLNEKPEKPVSPWACPPFYYFKSTARKHLDDFVKVESDAFGFFIEYLRQNEPVYAYKTTGTRLDIGNMESFKKADELLKHENVIIRQKFK